MVHDAVFGVALAGAVLVVLVGAHVRLVLLAVVPPVGALGRLRARPGPLVAALGLRLRVLLIRQVLSLLQLLGRELGPRVLVQVVVEVLPLLEVLVRLGDLVALAVDLDLVDLLEVVLEGAAPVLGIVPVVRLRDDRRNRAVVDHCADVHVVVHLAEDTALVRILHVHELKQLQPQVFQLVRVVLKQVEVVAHGGQHLVKELLQLAAVVLRLDLLLVDGLRGALTSLARLVTFGGFLVRRSSLDFNLHDELVFLGVLLQLVPDGTNNAFNFVLKETLQRVDGELVLVARLIQEALLLLNHGDHLGVVVSVLIRALSVVQVNKHVRQELLKSLLGHVVCGVLGAVVLLIALGLLPSLI